MNNVPQEGDSLAAFEADLDEADLAAQLRPPFANPAAVLMSASTRLLYDFFSYERTSADAHPQPAVVCTLARETHASQLAPPGGSQIQRSFSYFDGFGREVQKKAQAETGTLVEGGPDVPDRWSAAGGPCSTTRANPSGSTSRSSTTRRRITRWRPAPARSGSTTRSAGW